MVSIVHVIGDGAFVGVVGHVPSGLAYLRSLRYSANASAKR